MAAAAGLAPATTLRLHWPAGLARRPKSSSSSSRTVHAITPSLRFNARRVQRPCGRGARIAPRALFGGLPNLMQKDPAERTRKDYEKKVLEINALEPSMAEKTDEELQATAKELQQRVRERGRSEMDRVLPEAFALVREASKRVLGLRPFDSQLIGGIILHEGKISEMSTGEGKTLVAVLPAFLNALSGDGVHVVTVNDYLARRDSEWVGQVHRFLGLKCGLIQSSMAPSERRVNYSCDVTYVTNSEIGFDHLRDNLAQGVSELVLRPFSYCIIDEVDSILIDEARTPLIISGNAEKPSASYMKAFKLAKALVKDIHYNVDEKRKNVTLTEEGFAAAEDVLGVTDLFDPRNQWASYLLNAIKAKELHQCDVNYIVKDDQVLIVDEFTGRILDGRRWSEGLHQAIEAKEGVTIQNESITLASISYQSFFKQYPKLAGMTGTAATESAEFENIYGLQTLVVPTNRPRVRKDSSDVVFRTADAKTKAIITEIKRMNKQGNPVLVGTTSVEQSEILSSILQGDDIPHEVLNAKPENVERESEIVAQSGRLKAVTIATNMAGRGTDILLGGNPEFMAKLKVRSALMPELVGDGESNQELDDFGPQSKNRKKQSAEKKSIAAKWQPSPSIFPCELSEDVSKNLDSAVSACVEEFGKNSMRELDAEDKIALACEKAPIDNAALLQLRGVFREIEGTYKDVTERNKTGVIEVGGLHVIGTERHESRRVDNQLRGRSGRQGDPGSSRFFLSLEDNLFRVFGGDNIQKMMSVFNLDDVPIESSMLSNSLDTAQKRVETYFYDIRKNLYEYDQVLDSQRERIYKERRSALTAEAAELVTIMKRYSDMTVVDILEANITAGQPAEEIPFSELRDKFITYCKYFDTISEEEMMSAYKSGTLEEEMQKLGQKAYQLKAERVEEVQPGLMEEATRFFMLNQIDLRWREHLQAMKFLQQAVGLRGYAQRDPLTEYKLEGFNLFQEMTAQIRRNVIYSIYVFDASEIKPVDSKPAAAGDKDSKSEDTEVEKQTSSISA